MNNDLTKDKPLTSTTHRGRLSTAARGVSFVNGADLHPAAPPRDRHAVPWAARLVGVFMLTSGLYSQSMAAQPDEQMDEVDVTTRKQTALDAEAISLSDTPDAEPSVGGKTSILVGVAARTGPVYDGSKTNKTSPFPYIDIRGLFHDRIFISDVAGLGVNIIEQGAFRAGMSFNYGGGRTSSDATRLKGLPDIKSAASVAGFMTYSIKPFAFEVKVNREFGSQPGTEVELGASLAMAPSPRWHVSVGTRVNWHDSKFNQKYFGITPAEAAQATAVGNTMAAYMPGSGLGSVGMTATSVYAITEHWGFVTRLGLRDLIGSQAKDSPLTQRAFGVDFAVGAIYKF
jgi:outer membrane protein